MSAALVALASVLVDQDPWDHHGAWDGGGNGWFFLGVVLIAAWVALVTLAVWAFARRSEPTSADAGSIEPARKVLAARYARGEISTEEYRERVTTLDDS